MKYPKTQYWRSKEYLAWIDEQPSFLTGQTGCTHHHHRHGTGGGTGIKPSDVYCLPVTPDEHGSIHAGRIIIDDETAFKECLQLINKYLCEI